ncbi:MAG: TIGR04168 family protein [Cyanobacteriota bacterium]|nr:TIGR04168 family protein [Cyanobacteriota bacterium]
MPTSLEGENSGPRGGVVELAIAGDLHDQWDGRDEELLERLAPDVLLVVGDLSNGHTRIPRALARLALPMACVLGNHDCGHDATGESLRRQLRLLGERHCGWGLRELRPPGLAVVGARPATAGGGYHLSKAVRAVYGSVELEESVDRIHSAAAAADPALPLILLAHCGPAGLGSQATDPCGRDWKLPSCDWGDQDLALAIERIRRDRRLPLVVFGHMHHRLRRGGERITFAQDRRGTMYLNAACAPRHGVDVRGRALRHLSWVRLSASGDVEQVSHRWYGLDGSLLYEQLLWPPSRP